MTRVSMTTAACLRAAGLRKPLIVIHTHVNMCVELVMMIISFLFFFSHWNIAKLLRALVGARRWMAKRLLGCAGVRATQTKHAPSHQLTSKRLHLDTYLFPPPVSRWQQNLRHNVLLTQKQKIGKCVHHLTIRSLLFHFFLQAGRALLHNGYHLCSWVSVLGSWAFMNDGWRASFQLEKYWWCSAWQLTCSN